MRDLPEEYEEVKDKTGGFNADQDDVNLDTNHEQAS